MNWTTDKPTEAAWTSEKPTVEGWYWNRINGTVGIALIMRRDCQLYAWLKFKDAWLSREGWLDYIHGEFLGPLSPTDRQQGRVEAFKEASRKLDNLRDRCLTSNETDLHDFERWLAQAAQDEKEVGDA